MKKEIVAGGLLLALVMFAWAIQDVSYDGPTWFKYAGIGSETLLGISFLTVAVLEMFGIRPPAVTND